ncbi:hypothetical protein GSI_14215 [Ganoderma sinense ZZ0214-1]|uniref:Uncharacterized protein n=1 Tax=Ganoderma sinense ZZ0214-1 TaxID=1077348 RepID=A0A2G8RSI7_9APHY|nr:hypothetical protein GSI_14215 [Ganoderma sinense ZZ0214-1]
MPPSLPPPPARPSLFDIERSSSPPSCEDEAPVICEGMELTVYGLDRTTPRSAADHLRRVLHDLRQRPNRDSTPDVLYDVVLVRAADTLHCVDYAYLSLNRERVPQPRADLLQYLRKTLLDAVPSLRVQWRTQSQATKTPLPSDVILRNARSLFTDDPAVWPQTLSHYFYGTLPPLPAVIATHGDQLPTRRLLSRIAVLWHSASIRLVARIWGSYKRILYPFPPRVPSPLTLPPHISRLL